MNVGEHSVIDWLLALGGIAATVACVFVARNLGRRDRLEETVADHGEDISHIEGHLETKTGYRPRGRRD